MQVVRTRATIRPLSAPLVELLEQTEFRVPTYDDELATEVMLCCLLSVDLHRLSAALLSVTGSRPPGL
jgi:hypothetical protein